MLKRKEIGIEVIYEPIFPHDDRGRRGVVTAVGGIFVGVTFHGDSEPSLVHPEDLREMSDEGKDWNLQ